MSIYGCHMNLELQQRAVEYNSIFKKHNELRQDLFESMPEFENKNNLTNSNQNEETIDNEQDNDDQSDFIIKPPTTLEVILSNIYSLELYLFLYLGPLIN